MGFIPIGPAKSNAGEYTFSLFAVVAIALMASWFVAVLFAPVIGVRALKAPKPGDLDAASRLYAADFAHGYRG